MNRLTKLFEEKTHPLLSVFLTAGFPQKDSMPKLIRHLTQAGADMIEIGMPFSDPIADGPTIQQSNQVALQNGMNLNLLFEQLSDIRSHSHLPLLLMGYLNPVLQFGMQRFCRAAERAGIDGVILPDLPFDQYRDRYADLFEKHGLKPVFLISPRTPETRIRAIDALEPAFIYAVSSDATTGKTGGFSKSQLEYFHRLRNLGLKSPLMIGFGIHDRVTFETVSQYARGAIVGSAFIRAVSQTEDEKTVSAFVSQFRSQEPIQT